MSDTLRSARLKHGYSLGDIAHRLGVSRAAVQGYERRDADGRIATATRSRVLAAMESEPSTPTADQTRSLLLHTLVAAQLIRDPERTLARARQNLERLSAKDGADRKWVERWQRVLDRPVGEIALLLTEQSQAAADLRQGTPFSGVLDEESRLGALRVAREAERAT